MRVLVLVPLLTGCGDFLLVKGDVRGGTVEPADLSESTELAYYGLDGLLMAHVIVDGDQTLVDYQALLASPEAVDTVRHSVAQLGGVDPTRLADRDEQLAFYLNLYNLSVIAGVLAEREADPAFADVTAGDFAFFDVPRVPLGPDLLSLDAVEHGILRAEDDELALLDDDVRTRVEGLHDALWDDGIDARIHMGLNCSALSCPNLLPTVFRGETVDASLDAATTAFLDDPRKGAGPDGVSALFEWFEPDFVDDAGSVRAFVEEHRSDGLDDVDLAATLPYDWTLNGL